MHEGKFVYKHWQQVVNIARHVFIAVSAVLSTGQ